MASLLTSRTLAFIALILFAASACAQQRTGAWLMEAMHAQMLQKASQAQAAHHPAEAATWRDWAVLYARLAADPRAQRMDAESLARSNVQYNRREALAMEHNNMLAPAELYDASARMWAGLGQQLSGNAATLHVDFPEKQMLTPIAGLAGTPWQDLGGHHATDCRVLAQRAQSCRAQLSRVQQHALVAGEDSGDFQVVRMSQCNAAQELYVAQCVE